MHSNSHFDDDSTHTLVNSRAWFRRPAPLPAQNAVQGMMLPEAIAARALAQAALKMTQEASDPTRMVKNGRGEEPAAAYDPPHAPAPGRARRRAVAPGKDICELPPT